MRTATLDGDTVANIIEAENTTVLPGVTLVEIPEHVGIGWTTPDGGQTWQPPPPPPPSPQQTSRQQLLDMLAETPKLSQRIASDAALWEATQPDSTLGQHHIDSIVRVVNGFQTVMDALTSLGVATGVLPPPETPA